MAIKKNSNFGNGHFTGNGCKQCSTGGNTTSSTSSCGCVTNLGYIANSASGFVISSTGNNAIVPLANSTLAGLLSPAQFLILESIIDTDTIFTITQNSTYVELIDDGTPENSIINFVVNGIQVGSVGLDGDMPKWTLDGILDPTVFAATPIDTATRDTLGNVAGYFIYNLDNSFFEYNDGSTWITFAGGGGGATNLGTSLASNAVIVTSSTGTDAIIPAATTSLAGAMSSTDKTNLTGAVNSIGTPTLNISNVLTIPYTSVNGSTTLVSVDMSALSSTSYTDEEAQDATGSILVDSTTIDFTYTDSTPAITASVKISSTAGNIISVSGSGLYATNTTTANNGITRTGNNIQLGGLLVQNTTIDGDGNILSLSNLAELVINAASITIESANTTNIIGATSVTLNSSGGSYKMVSLPAKILETDVIYYNSSTDTLVKGSKYSSTTSFSSVADRTKDVILLNGTTISLPAANTVQDRVWCFKNISTTVDVIINAPDNIDGTDSLEILPLANARIMSDGVTYWII